MITPVIGREGLLRLVEWAERLRGSSGDGGGGEGPGEGLVGVVSGGDPERRFEVALILERLTAICGHRMQVSYERGRQGLTGRYCCQRRRHTYGEPRCQRIAARFLDGHVVAEVLSALAPAALELSVTSARQVEAHRAEVDRIWRQRLERADFLCDRARRQRQYQLAEPENRLVVRQLEREWKGALLKLKG